MNKIKKGLGRGLSSLIGETKVEKSTSKLSISELILAGYRRPSPHSPVSTSSCLLTYINIY